MTTRTLSNGWTLDLLPIERTDVTMRTVALTINGDRALKISICGDDLYSVYPAPVGSPAHVAGVAHCRAAGKAVQIGLTTDEMALIRDWLAPERAIRATAKAQSAERARKAREYDLIINEGGEGYNPYRDEKGCRTYVSITRYDTQTTDHVLVGYGHLYGTAAGTTIAAEFGIPQ